MRVSFQMSVKRKILNLIESRKACRSQRVKPAITKLEAACHVSRPACVGSWVNLPKDAHVLHERELGLSYLVSPGDCVRGSEPRPSL